MTAREGGTSATSRRERRSRRKDAWASGKPPLGQTAELWFGLTVFVVDILCQIALMVLGFYIVLGDVFSPYEEDHVSIIEFLVTWCIFGTLYGLGAIAATFISSRRAPQPLGTLPADRPLQRFVYRVEHSPIARFITTISTFIVSIVGLTAAVELLVLRNDPDWGFLIKAVAIWTMLLSWALFHWGYARLYARTYRMASDPKPLSFPGNEEPGLADFVYFAFTTASAFSASDVSVMTRRMRWTVIWHSTLSFFFNALIVVRAVNTLIQA